MSEGSRDDDARPREWLRSTWPLQRSDWAEALASLVGVIAAFTIVGFALTKWFAPNAVTDLDRRVARQLADGRAPGLTDLARAGAFLADTPVKIAVSIAVAVYLLWRFRRWHEAAFVGLTLAFEATAYIVSSTIIGRPRPEVEQLLHSPVDTSFPSGHVAAATVYAALAIIVFWHTRSSWARGLAVIAAIIVPAVVGWARMYQGMHYLSDVIAGVALGAVSLIVCVRILGAPTTPVTDTPVAERERSNNSLADVEAVAR